MKISKEVKVGVLGIIGLVLLYYGFNFLKGSDIFSSTKDYHLTFKDVMGLEVSNTVTYNGVVVGRVSSVAPDYENDRVNVVVSLKKEVKITDKSDILLADAGLVGGKTLILRILPGNPLPPGSQVKTGVQTGLLGSVTEMLDPTLEKVDSLLSTLNVVATEFQDSGNALKTLLASATQSTAGLNAIMASNSKNLNTITGNAAVLTADLNRVVKDLDTQLKPILANATKFTDSLSSMQIAATMDKLDATVASFQSIMSEINSGKGTIGKLTSNDSLYMNLNNTAESLNKLMVDLKANPKRYVHFSLFGRKDKTKPEEPKKEEEE
ncbi:MAG: MCE family protein [Leadbetterella sp.]|nr:MCE family protein [Leadbetterella sp.]